MPDPHARAPHGGRIGVLVVTCNEGDLLETCLTSVADWVDEIHVVDMESDDNSVAIAEAHQAIVWSQSRVPHVELVRARYLPEVTTDWILVLDPDESVTPELAAELRRVAGVDHWDVVDLPRVQVAFGQSLLSEGCRDGVHPRFFRSVYATWPSEIHSHPDFGGLARLNLGLIPDWREQGLFIAHDTWRSPHQVLEKFSRYVAAEAAGRPQQFSVAAAFRSTWGEFRKRILVGRAYDDGVPGLLHALLFTVYELGVQAEMWERDGRSAVHDGAVQNWGRRASAAHRLWNRATHPQRTLKNLLRRVTRRR